MDRSGGCSPSARMWSRAVVAADVDAEDMFEVVASDDEQSGEAFAADCADPAFPLSVRVRRTDRYADDLDVLT